MAESVDEKWSIDKLNASNWMTWKFQMRHLLLAKGLWGYVDGSEVLAEDATTATQADFRKKSQKAFSTLVMAISTPQLYLVTSCDKPKDAWDKLCEHFECKTLANKLFLKKKYFRTEMKEGTSMETHLKHMKEITDRLASIGAPISEEDQVVTLLGSLPPSYSTIVTALEARVDNVNLPFVQQALIHEEHKRSVQTDDTASRSDLALMGTRKYDNSRKPRCFGCGKLGHIRRDCPEKRGFPAVGHNAKAAEEEHSSESDSEGVGAFAASTGSVKSARMDRWLVDSGASSHMTREKNLLTSYREFETPEKVGLGDGRSVEALGVGDVHLSMLFKMSKPKKAVVHQVLYVPKLACNLFSVRAAASRGNVVKFGQSKCWIRDRDGKLRGMGSLTDKVYQLNCKPLTTEQASPALEERNGVNLWHQRFGHLNTQQLMKIVDNQLALGVKIPKNEKMSFCEGCIEGKMHRHPFKPVGEIRSSEKLQLVHSDVCGPMHTESFGGQKYFVTFIDDFSRCCAVYFMKKKSEVLEKFKEFEAITTNESGRRVIKLRTDNGGEYVSQEFETYLKSKGIQHELTVPHSPQQNGVAERMNRTLTESARAMIAHAKLPNDYWAEAIATAAYVKNRAPTTAFETDTTPYERWYGKKPDVTHLKVFGCIAYAHVPDVQRRKLDKKANKLRFVGYSTKSKGYRLFDDETRKVFIRRDVLFNEIEFNRKHGEKAVDQSKVTINLSPRPEETNGSEESSQCPPDTTDDSSRRSQRQRQPPVRYGFDEFVDMATEDQVHHTAYHVCQILEPQTIEEALKSNQAKEWKAAADSEYESLIANDTWELPMVEMKKVKESLATKFRMTDMGKLHYCLGITIVQDEGKKCLWLHQKQYVQNVLEKYSLTEAKVTSTPADLSIRLEKDDGVSAEVDPILYQSMVRSLLYAACATCPDIAHAVGTVTKFSSKPTEAHQTAVKRIFKYLKGSASLALKYQKVEGDKLIGYCDADWAGDRDDRHSTSGNRFLMVGGPISWLSKKQAIVALSTSEAEYVALCTATQEAAWLRRLLTDLKVTNSEPTVVMEDNQGAIAIAKNPTAHARTKHVDIRYHYVREAVQEGVVELRYCPTAQMIADLLTDPAFGNGNGTIVTQYGTTVT